MKTIPYYLVVGSLMYALVCTRPNIAFVVDLLGRFLSDLGQRHWKVAKKVLRYLQGTKDLMLTYRRIETLGVVGLMIPIIQVVWMIKSQLLVISL